jgi:hypothetical protein
MCPLCIVNAAVMAAGVGSTGGVLAACVSKSKDCVNKSKHGIGKFRNLFSGNGQGLSQHATSNKIKEK